MIGLDVELVMLKNDKIHKLKKMKLTIKAPITTSFSMFEKNKI